MILLVSAVFPPEPVVASTLGLDLAVAFSKYSQVTVLRPRPSRPEGFNFPFVSFKEYNFQQITVKSYVCPRSSLTGRLMESFSFGYSCINYIRKKHSEIQCVYIKAWPLASQFMLVRAAKQYGIPSILHIQDIYPESMLDKLPFLKSLIYKLLLPIDSYTQKNASRVITISPTMRKYLIKTRKLDECNVELVYNWQDEKRFMECSINNYKFNKRKEQFTFMFLGNLNKTAGIEFIIKAFASTNIKNAKLVIAGNGSEKEYLKTYAESNFRDSKIEFINAPVDKVPAIQSGADVLILCLKKKASRFAFPSKMIAYMFSSKPIIASVDEDSDTASAIKLANCGWIVPPEDSNSLKEVMSASYLLDNMTLGLLGRNGLDYAMKNFSKDINISKIKAIVKSNLKDLTIHKAHQSANPPSINI